MLKNKYLFLIIPSTLLVGYLLGLYIGIPKHITIGYDESFERTIDKLNNLSVNISAKNCPDCNCDCKFYNDGYVCFEENKYTIIPKQNIILK